MSNENNTSAEDNTQQPQSKFKNQLLLVILGTLFIPMIILAYSFYDQWANMGKTEGTAEVGRVAVKVADTVDRELSNQVAILRAFAATKGIEAGLDALTLPQYWDGIAIISNNNISRLKGSIDTQAAKELAASYAALSKKNQYLKVSNTTILHRNGEDILLFCYPLSSGTYIISQINFPQLIEAKALSYQKKNNKNFDIFIVDPKGDILYQINNTSSNVSKITSVKDISNDTVSSKITSMNPFSLRVNEGNAKSFVYGAYPSKVFGEFQGLNATYVLKVPGHMVQERGNSYSGFLLMGIFAILLLLIYYSINFRQSVTGKAAQTDRKWYE